MKKGLSLHPKHCKMPNKLIFRLAGKHILRHTPSNACRSEATSASTLALRQQLNSSHSSGKLIY